jgi:hypothetical protein
VVIEICVKYPERPTRKTGTGILHDQRPEVLSCEDCESSSPYDLLHGRVNDGDLCWGILPQGIVLQRPPVTAARFSHRPPVTAARFS